MSEGGAGLLNSFAGKDRPWPADAVQRRPVSSLVAYEKNARVHSPEQISQIADSIREWGWTIPVLIDPDGGLIAGHGRLAAAQMLGYGDVPCMVAEGWSDAQKKAYVIADNKLAENASWDEALLAEEMQALADLDYAVGLVGFADEDLADLLHTPFLGQSDPDEAPEVSDEVVTRAGDIWQLGVHRLRCGDSTCAADVEALLEGAKPNLMATDPPYGVEYDPAWRKQFGGASVATGKVMNDDRADWREAWALFPGDVAYVWHGALHAREVEDSLVASGFSVRVQIVWVKTRAAISRGHYHYQHEPAFYAERDPEDGWSVDQENLAYVVRTGKSANWRGGRKQTTVWFIEHLKNDTGHGTQKPVECMRRPIVNNSSPGQAVYDPFCGSGTTIIAGEMENRPVYAMELDPRYCDVIVRRWKKFTGGEAVLAGSGRSFGEVEAERLGVAV